MLSNLSRDLRPVANRRALLLSAGVTAAALLAGHKRFWRETTFWKQPQGRVYTYLFGVGCLHGGITLWAALTRNWLAWRAVSTIIGAGGAAVLGAWVLRGEQTARRDFALFGEATRAVRTLPRGQQQAGRLFLLGHEALA